MSANKKRKADLKVVILGSASVGKTTFINRYIEGRFHDTISTIGASFSLKQWGCYNIAIWDTAGEERFQGLSSFYSRGAGAAILAFDLNNKESFDSLRDRFLPLLESAEDDCFHVVVGMKLDLVTPKRREVSFEEALIFAKDINKGNLQEVPYFETSSLTGHNVNKVFESIFQLKLPLDGPAQFKQKDPSVVHLDSPTTPSSKTPQANQRGGCCR